MDKPKAIYSNGKWRKIETCSFCGCRYWEKDIEDYICFELIFNGIDRGSDDVRIYNLNGIKANCPLIDWDLARWHSVNEIPKMGKLLLIEYEDRGLVESDYAIRKKSGGYSGGYSDPCEFLIHGEGLVDSRGSITVLRWRYVDEQ